MPEDKRITKTRALLRGTLQEMLETISFDGVKVKQICKKGGVSRVTFYSHFADKYALLHDLYADFLNCAMRRCIDKCRKSGKKDDVVSYMITLFVSYAEELYAGRKPFFRAIFEEKGDAYSLFVKFIEKAAAELIGNLRTRRESDLSDAQLLSLICRGPMDFLRAAAFDDDIDAERAAALCRDYYKSVMSFVLKNH